MSGWAKAFNELLAVNRPDKPLDFLVEKVGAELDSMDMRLEALECAPEAPAANPVGDARAVMREHLEADEGIKQAYIANIGMLIHDEISSGGYRPKLRSTDREVIAEGVLKLLFWD